MKRPSEIIFEFSQDMGLDAAILRVFDFCPQALALINDETALSYAEVSELVSNLASHLQDQGVSQGDRVAIVAARTPRAIIAMLAVLRCGAVVLPLDPAESREHLKFIIGDSAPSLILWDSGQDDLVTWLASAGQRCLSITITLADPALPSDFPLASGEDPAFILYTAGPEGQPKGAILPHRCIARMALGQKPSQQIRPQDVVLQNAPVGSGGALMQVFGALLNGAALAIHEGPLIDLGAIDRTISRHGVSVGVFYTAAFELLAEHYPATLAAMRLVLVGDDVLSPGKVRNALQQNLVALKDFPFKATRVAEGEALVALAQEKQAQVQPERATPARAHDAASLSRIIAEVWSQVLGCPSPRGDDTFFGLGGTSLHLVTVRARLQERIGHRIDITTMFEAPRLRDLASQLERELSQTVGDTGATASTSAKATPQELDLPANAIAIIGMSGRFPGVRGIDGFWQALRDGRNLITRFDAEEIEDAFTDEERAAPDYVPVRPVLDDADMFDARFFGILPREAQVMDPQHRIFLEICYEALESAGHDPFATSGRVGVFAGQTANTYAANNLLGSRDLVEDFTSNFQVGNYAIQTGNWVDSLTTRVSFKLDLKGPSFTLQTACSTSLTAIAQAIESLLAGACDMALAGGVSISFPQKRGYRAIEGGMVSPEGVCRPFDAQASGTVFGHGAGVVLLKPLEQAVADGDPIIAVIRGAGVNNDGAAKMSYTAPSVTGQAEAIRLAHKAAGIDPATISYVECHGTATPLGDPIELAGLAQAFGSGCPAGTVAIGSVKGNIGHLDAAAGVVSVIKTALMLQHREIPPVANYRSPNPKFDFSSSPFFVPDGLKPWQPVQGPRRAGVSSFGVGGTNVHVVMEEAPPPRDLHRMDASQILPHILPLAARTPEALAAMRGNLADFLETANPDLADVAHTLQEGRHAFALRSAIACDDVAGAVASLRMPLSKPRAAPDEPPPVVFMFAGQGSQYPGMGSGLHANEPVFRDWINRGAEILQPLIGFDINELLCFGDTTDDAAARALRETRLTQPALYMVQMATAKLLESRGVRPAAMIGHSVGELAAATLSGVMDFETGLRIIATRGRLMQEQPGGAMLSVRTSLEDVARYLDDSVDIAARNAPKLNVLSGSFDAISALEQRLGEAGVPHARLHTSHAFHSRMMDPVCDALLQALQDIALAEPKIPFVSCVTGKWITKDEACDPAYWAGQARATVDFVTAIRAVVEGQLPVLLEVGAGSVLSTFAGQTLPRDGHGGIISTLPDHTRPISDNVALARSAGQLWSAGVNIEWHNWRAGEARRIAVPTYPFERQRYWKDAPPTLRRQSTAVPPEPATLLQPALLPPSAVSAAAATMTQTGADMSKVISFDAGTAQPSRQSRLIDEVASLLTELSGEDVTASDADASFLELGFDSLFLGQVTQRLSKTYGTQITFRQLLSDYPTTAALAGFLDSFLPPDPVVAATPSPVAVHVPSVAPAPLPTGVDTAAAHLKTENPVAPVMRAAQSGERVVVSSGAQDVMQQQIMAMQSIFSEQLRVLGGVPASVGAATTDATTPPPMQDPAPVARTVSAEQSVPTPAVGAGQSPGLPTPAHSRTADDEPVRYSIGRGVTAGAAALTPQQLRFAQDLAARYAAKYSSSKAYAGKHRGVLADPRSAAGFRQEWKEMVFPIVAARSRGARIWDLDGNEFIDIVNGFGQTAFGHAPDFVDEALRRQMDSGYAIGPQSDLSGPVAAKFAKMTGHERVTFCNTGSEAVMAAMRVARAVTGRERVVVFGNDYHGQFDEVLVKGRARGGPPAALPIAPGIPRSALSNMTVLPYGGEASLDWIRANGDEIAAIIIEPVQSRHPEHRPVEFVHELRALADQIGAALVFDEVVTGFRVHARGMQGIWGIRADLATYGKVVGGGMPIGVLAGDARFMNALDGGVWTYGDASQPDTAPTFFAGTFVRHPLVLAAVDATLDHMAAQGDDLWTRVAARTGELVQTFDSIFDSRGLPPLIQGFSSWYAFNLMQHTPSAALAYPLMRLSGLHVQEGYCGFMTTAHSEADFQSIATIMADTVDALQSVGILVPEQAEGNTSAPTRQPPISEAVQATKDQAATEGATKDGASAAVSGVPLTPEQQEVWMAAQAGDLASASFNEGMLVHFKGPLDRSILQRALDKLIARHDALRLVFARNGETFDVAEPYSLAVPLHDLRTTADQDSAYRALLDEEARAAFDLVNGPALRALLVQRGDADHTLVLNAHHIVCDGWSYNVALKELSVIYDALAAGRTPDLKAAPSFATYAVERAARSASASADDVKYWRSEFLTVPPLPELPTDRPRGVRRSFAASTLTAHMDAGTASAIRKSGARLGCTLFATLFAGLHIVLGRLSGSQDHVIGVPTAGQSQLSDPDMMGHCVNFLPIRATIDPAATVAENFAAVREKVLAAFEHSDTTYGALVQSLNLQRSLDRLPLTEVQFNLEKVAEEMSISGLDIAVEPNAKAAANFDLFFNVIESRDGLRFDVDYNTALYDAETVRRWIGHLEALLLALADNAQKPVAALPMMTDEQARALECRHNETDADFPHMPLHELLRRRMESASDAQAVVAPDGTLSYAELDAETDALAARIQALLPEPGKRVAIALDRSRAMIVSLIAVLKAGHAYVPLDPRQPDTRLRLILEAAAASAIISQGDSLPAYAEGLGLALVAPDGIGAARPVVHAIDPESAAYVIFTSGSTGTPKGVEVSHRAVVNLLVSMAAQPGFGPADTLLAVTTVSFDIAMLELFLPLLVGGRVVIARTEDVLDGFRLVERIEKGDISVIQATPTLWSMLLEAGLKPSKGLKMLVGGEPLPIDLAKRLTAGGGELWNMYGPTETTIWSAAHRIDPGAERVTIGYPIANTQLHVLDPLDRLAPLGTVGELNIGGQGLANGYFGRDDLTASAFREIALPGGPQMLYRTGDLARKLADGTIEVLGRIDGQIKLRGFRIELGEIEMAMRQIDGVDKAAVALQDDPGGQKQLVGYVVPAAGCDPAARDLMQALRSRLPEYMVPTAWVTLSALPQTLNGKLDRKALPRPTSVAAVTPLRSVVAPVSDFEVRLTEIWKQVLGLDEIGTTETLFALGADSLKVFRIASRMLEAGLDLEARHLLQYPTIRELAAYAASPREDNKRAARPSLRDFRHGARRQSSQTAMGTA